MNGTDTFRFCYAMQKMGSREARDHWNDCAGNLLDEKKLLMSYDGWDGSGYNYDAVFLGRHVEEWVSKSKALFDSRCLDYIDGFSGYIFPWDVSFQGMKFRKEVNFRQAEFYGLVNFADTEFFLDVDFTHAVFHGYKLTDGNETNNFKRDGYIQFFNDFSRAKFHGSIIFNGVKFNNKVSFEDAIFNKELVLSDERFMDSVSFKGARFGKSDFKRCVFDKDADFSDVVFSDISDFSNCNFESVSKFTNAKFYGDANLEAIVCDNVIDFSDAVFRHVPNLKYCRFSVPPRLDNFKIGYNHLGLLLAGKKINFCKRLNYLIGNIDDRVKAKITRIKEARSKLKDENPKWFDERYFKYKELKRIAIDAHDHQKEMDFFAGELENYGKLKSKCGVGNSLLIKSYSFFSDFGRSIKRPFIYLVTIIILSCFVYLFNAKENDVCNNISDKFSSSLYVSSYKSAILPSMSDSFKVDQSYACLYGFDETYRNKIGSNEVIKLSPKSPFWVTVTATIQTLFSAIFIFLILLGIRNHFKIK